MGLAKAWLRGAGVLTVISVVTIMATGPMLLIVWATSAVGEALLGVKPTVELHVVAVMLAVALVAPLVCAESVRRR